MPLNARNLEIIVVGPNRQLQVQRQRQDIGVVRVATANPASRFYELSPVLGAINDGDREGGQGEKKGIELKPSGARAEGGTRRLRPSLRRV